MSNRYGSRSNSFTMNSNQIQDDHRCCSWWSFDEQELKWGPSATWWDVIQWLSMAINKGANKEDHKTACNQNLISNSSTVRGNNEDISKQTYRVNFVKGVMKTTIVKLVTIFPLSKMNKPTTSTTIKSRTTRTPARTIQDGGTIQICNGGTIWRWTFSCRNNNHHHAKDKKPSLKEALT